MFASDKPDEHGIEQGVEWTIRPGPSNWNGYARLPENHPWRNLPEEDIPVTAHGGVTYKDDETGWIGFDTMHPGDEYTCRDARGGILWQGHGHEWTKQEATDETKSLARQIAANMNPVPVI